MSDLFHPRSKRARNYRHGHKPADGISPEYLSWRGMRARCNKPHDPNYRNYGARGITVCARWQESFVAFLEDMGQKPSPDHSIDRIDVNGNYEPNNCRWATNIEQANNRRTSRILTHRGKSMTLAEWSREVGIDIRIVHFRLKFGWPVADALDRPVRPIRKRTA